jgi:SAM-dependent methyltransferase
MAFLYGMKLGVQSVVKGRTTREALKNILVPVNYWRTVEFRYVLNSLRPDSRDTILDIGSPKLLSLYIADVLKATVYATDIESYFLGDYGTFREVRNIPEDRYHTMPMDGRHLTFPDNHFSKVFSVSVLEHIPDRGDSECVKEIARVLKPGGLCSITVPFSPASVTEVKSAGSFYWSGSSKDVSDGTTFFQRRYSEADLHERLIAPSGLRVRELLFIGERIAIPSLTEVGRIIHPVIGPVHPFLSALLHTQPTADWKSLSHPLAALLLLEK